MPSRNNIAMKEGMNETLKSAKGTLPPRQDIPRAFEPQHLTTRYIEIHVSQYNGRNHQQQGGFERFHVSKERTNTTKQHVES
jgi:hypothetical protein